MMMITWLIFPAGLPGADAEADGVVVGTAVGRRGVDVQPPASSATAAASTMIRSMHGA